MGLGGIFSNGSQSAHRPCWPSSLGLRESHGFLELACSLVLGDSHSFFKQTRNVCRLPDHVCIPGRLFLHAPTLRLGRSSPFYTNARLALPALGCCAPHMPNSLTDLAPTSSKMVNTAHSSMFAVELAAVAGCMAWFWSHVQSNADSLATIVF